MIYLKWLPTLSILLCASLAQAESKIVWDVSPVVLFNSGTTDYTIDFPGYFDVTEGGDSVLVWGRSQLEFPLDATLVGVDLVARTKTGTGKDLTFSAGILTNLTDPSEKMLDHDWWINSEDGSELKFSFTESDAKMSYLLLKLEAAISVMQRPKVQLEMMAGFHYNKIEYDMMGYEGWYVGGDGRTYPYLPGDPNVKSLYYKATYKLPHAGVRLNLTPNWRTTMGAQIAVGRLMASDLDDHLLRGKTAEATTTGWAFLGRARGRLLLSQHGSTRPFLTAQIEYVKQNASGSQTQIWYREGTYPDPVTGEPQTIEKGTTVPGIPYETSTRQMRFGFGFGLSF